MTIEMKPSFGLKTLYGYLIFVSWVGSNWCIHFLLNYLEYAFYCCCNYSYKALFLCSNVSQSVVQRLLASVSFRVVVNINLYQNTLTKSLEWEPRTFMLKQAIWFLCVPNLRTIDVDNVLLFYLYVYVVRQLPFL